MKHLITVTLITIISLTGCATSRVATELGTEIGNAYQKAAAEGTVSATESIKAWPYISGQIKGLVAANYELDMPESLKLIIDDLDRLAAKPVDGLTDEDKGFIIGSFCRLEVDAVRLGWEKYGGRITGLLSRVAGL